MTDDLRRRALRLLRAVPTPVLEMAVRLGSPSYTLGAVCRIEHEGRVLLVQAAYRRTWGMPGGLLSRRESPADGVRREVREEVGLDVRLTGEPIVMVDLQDRLIDFLYRGELAPGVSPDEASAASGEIDRVGWFPAREVLDLVTGPARMSEKVDYYERMPAGGLVVLEPERRRWPRRGRRAVPKPAPGESPPAAG